MFIEPTITWVPSGFSGYIWRDTKIVLKAIPPSTYRPFPEFVFKLAEDYMFEFRTASLQLNHLFFSSSQLTSNSSLNSVASG